MLLLFCRVEEESRLVLWQCGCCVLGSCNQFHILLLHSDNHQFLHPRLSIHRNYEENLRILHQFHVLHLLLSDELVSFGNSNRIGFFWVIDVSCNCCRVFCICPVVESCCLGGLGFVIIFGYCCSYRIFFVDGENFDEIHYFVYCFRLILCCLSDCNVVDNGLLEVSLYYC